MRACEECFLPVLQLEQALDVSEKDVKDASEGVLKDLKRFQGQKEEDLRRNMVRVARFRHLHYSSGSPCLVG